jgi:predicted acylesterase/phospholipase RssA
MADRVLIVVPPDQSADELERLEGVLTASPSGVPRTVAIMHPATTSVPTNTASLVDRFNGTDVINLGAGDAEVGRLARTVVGRGFGLVLGGGGARGFAHLGVYMALRESGVEIDVVAGSSIGSILAAVLADAPPPEDLIEMAQERFANVLDYTIPVVSLIKGDRIAHSIRAVFGDRHIEDLWRPFACVSTDLTTSRSHLHRRGPLVHALRASSSIPGVMPPVPHGDRLLVDGGVLDNLPVDLIRRLTPNGEVVAVDVAPVRGPEARRDFGLSVSGWQAVRAKRGRGLGVPRITAVLMRSMIVASQRERDRQIADGLADLYLDLDLRGVSMLDFSDVAGVARRGYEAAMPRLEEWLRSRGDQ